MLVRVPLYPNATRVSASRRFVMFSYVVTICDVARASMKYTSLSYFWYEHFVINIPSRIIYSMTLFVASFSEFSSCINNFLRGWSFFINCIYFHFLCYCLSLIFLTWLFCDSIYRNLQYCCSNEILLLFITFSMPVLFPFPPYLQKVPQVPLY